MRSLSGFTTLPRFVLYGFGSILCGCWAIHMLLYWLTGDATGLLLTVGVGLIGLTIIAVTSLTDARDRGPAMTPIWDDLDLESTNPSRRPLPDPDPDLDHWLRRYREGDVA